MKRLAVILLLAALVVLVSSPGPVEALLPNRVGWWYKLNQGPLSGFGVVTPQPPNAEPEGLYVANDNDPAQGPLAISALEFIVQFGGDATLTLKATPNSNFTRAAIVACPATTPWSQSFGGKWDQRPQYNCTLGKVVGKASPDGSSMTWTITPKLLANPTTYNFVLAPDPSNPAPFAEGAKAPDETALSTPQPSAQTPSGFTAPAGAAPAARAAARFSSPTSLGSDSILPLLSEAPALPAVTEQAAPRRALPVTPVGDSTTDRLAASAMLALIAVGLALVSARQGRPAEALAGGIGRFARVREVPPTRL